MTNKNNSRTDHLSADQNMIDGIAKSGSLLPASFPLEGKPTSTNDVTVILQERIATAKAVVTTEAAHTAAVKADTDKRTATRAFVTAFRRMLVIMFAKQPDVLASFGIPAPKPRKQSAASKAAAATKGKATRKTLGTKGSLQKKEALAQAEANAPAQATPPAPAPAPTTAPKPVS